MDRFPQYPDPADQRKYERLCAALERVIAADPVGAADFAARARFFAPVDKRASSRAPDFAMRARFFTPVDVRFDVHRA